MIYTSQNLWKPMSWLTNTSFESFSNKRFLQCITLGWNFLNLFLITVSLLKWKLDTGADTGFAPLCKWRSRISFLWNVKQNKKSLRGVFKQSRCAKFECGWWLLRCWSFPQWISYFEASNLRTFAELFLEEVSLLKFLITIACKSLTLIFFNIIPAIKHAATYFAAW